MIPQHYLNSIITGDARELAKAIPDESIDLIFTDPVYDRLEDYEWLSRLATRILKPDSACLVWQNVAGLASTIPTMSRGLSYRWLIIWYQSNNMRALYKIFNKYVPLLWFEKGKSQPRLMIQDLRNVPLAIGDGSQDKLHKWAKRTEIIEYYLEAFTQPGALVFDPFTGSGTVPAVCKMLGRDYIAFEIDPDTAAKARERVLNTQPPLFVLEPQQTELGLD